MQDLDVVDAMEFVEIRDANGNVIPIRPIDSDWAAHMLDPDAGVEVEELVTRNRLQWNVFCPTGPGGGRDPSCGKSDGGAKLPNPSDVTVLKNLPGSTGPKLVADADGNKWVMKDAPNKEKQLANEVDADNAYRALGIKVPDSGLSGTAKFSKFLEDATPLKDLPNANKQLVYQQLGKNFVADALLANWDVVGLSMDNVLVKGGGAYRVDNGGALKYRAQGAEKGAAFGAEVKELKTLRDPSLNPSSAKVFAHLTDADIKNQIKDVVSKKDAVLAAVKDKDTRAILEKRFQYLELIQHGESLKTIGATQKELDSLAHEKKLMDEYHAAKAGKLTPSVSKDLPWKPAGDAAYVHGGAIASAVAKVTGVKMTPNQLKKIEHLNPEGTTDGTLKVSKSVTGKTIEKLKAAFPGVKVEKVHASTFKDLKAGAKTIDDALTIKAVTKGADGPGVKLGSVDKDHGAKIGTSGPPDAAAGKAWASKLSGFENGAMSSWFGSSGWARKDVINKPKDQWSKETVALMSALEKAPKYQGTVYRGMHNYSSKGSEKVMAEIAAAGVGGTWKDPGPHSMSRSGVKASSFASSSLLLKIETKTGRSIENHPSEYGEKEVVGMPNTQYRIKNIVKGAMVQGDGKQKMFVHLEEI